MGPQQYLFHEYAVGPKIWVNCPHHQKVQPNQTSIFIFDVSA